MVVIKGDVWHCFGVLSSQKSPVAALESLHKDCLSFSSTDLPSPRDQPLSVYTVLLGTISSYPEDNEMMELRAVARCIKHPSYSADEHSSGDIALVQLASPISFNDYILPVCLPKPGDPLDAGTMCWVTGWGYIDTNKRKDVWTWWQCRGRMGGPVLIPSLWPVPTLRQDLRLYMDRVYAKNVHHGVCTETLPQWRIPSWLLPAPRRPPSI